MSWTKGIFIIFFYLCAKLSLLSLNCYNFYPVTLSLFLYPLIASVQISRKKIAILASAPVAGPGDNGGVDALNQGTPTSGHVAFADAAEEEDPSWLGNYMQQQGSERRRRRRDSKVNEARTRFGQMHFVTNSAALPGW